MTDDDTGAETSGQRIYENYRLLFNDRPPWEELSNDDKSEWDRFADESGCGCDNDTGADSGPSLRELFYLYGTDKGIGQLHKLYEPLLVERRRDVFAVCEIGIGTLDPDAPWSMAGHGLPHYRPGGSLRAWRDWFPRATIWGIDVAPDTMIEDEPRIVTKLADSTDFDALREVLPGYLRFDLVVDDGNHGFNAQLATLRNMWPRVAPGGFYVIEDRKNPHRYLAHFNATTVTMPHAVYGSAIVYRKAGRKLTTVHLPEPD